MKYISTRGEAPELGFEDVLLTGLARDGGLYVPRTWPHLSPGELRPLRGRSYEDVAYAVMAPFTASAIPATEFRRMIAAALGYLPVVQGALLREAIDVAVILNALRALR